jgi:hypothetical protein
VIATSIYARRRSLNPVRGLEPYKFCVRLGSARSRTNKTAHHEIQSIKATTRPLSFRCAYLIAARRREGASVMAKKKKKKERNSSGKTAKKAKRASLASKPRKAAKKSHRRRLAAASAAPKSAQVIMEFTKSDDSPDDVRITLFEPTKRALEQGEKNGRSNPRSVGDSVHTLVNVMVPQPTGGKRTAVITVTHSDPAILVVTVPDGESGADGVTTLDVI